MTDIKVQYSAQFEIRASEKFNGSLSQGFIAIVEKWLHRKYQNRPDHVSRQNWLQEGGEWRIGSSQISAMVDVIREEDHSEPILWSFRLQHPDSYYKKSRIWVTEILLSNADDDLNLVHITNGYYIPTGYIGKTPKEPNAFPPKFVETCFKNTFLEIWTNGNKLQGSPKLLGSGEGKDFAHILQDQSRDYPIVVVNHSEDFSVDLKKLQKRLLGKAEVYVVRDPEIIEEMSHYWKLNYESYKCYKDTVRVYQAKLNYENPADYHRHRYFKFENDEQEVLAIVANSLMRMPNLIAPAKPSRYEDVKHHRRLIRLRELKNSTNKADSKDYILLLEEDNSQMYEKTNSLQVENNGLKEELIEYTNKLELSRKSIENHEKQFSDLSKQLSQDSISKENQELSVELTELPTKLSDITTLIMLVHPNKLCFMDEAKKSASQYNCKDINSAWKLLVAMATALHDLYFKQQGEDIEAKFRATGFTLKKTEGAATKKNSNLTRLRKRKYKDEEVYIWAHTNLDKGSNNLRAYFYIDKVSKLIAIGHFGKHLETAGSKRRKEG